jgi:ribosomal protein S18 acetylase RimI-like enzyme
MNVRRADEGETSQLAQIWYEGWCDAHLEIRPAELARDRSLESFLARLEAALADVRVAGPPGEPAGFAILKNDELYQLCVSRQSRGAGIAAALIADAEARLARQGVRKAWLACAIGNERAARFYEKSGWHRVGSMTSILETANGPCYEKNLADRLKPSLSS